MATQNKSAMLVESSTSIGTDADALKKTPAARGSPRGLGGYRQRVELLVHHLTGERAEVPARARVAADDDRIAVRKR